MTLMARTYSNIANIYQMQCLLDNSLLHHQKALTIYEIKFPNSYYVAATYNNIGVIYQHQGLLDEALSYHQKALEIKERLSPGSVSLAETYNNVGNVYQRQDCLDKALPLYEKSFEIKNEKLISSHPKLVVLSHIIANIALKLNLLQKALKYVEISISKDKDYKLAHDTKALILKQQSMQEEKPNAALPIYL